ncbi:pyridoxamine 5'-phosphate oxidase family protein [Xylophilus sp. GW821-FHT01B05]
MAIIQTVEQLTALYGEPGEASLVKEADHITPAYAALIAASPFAALATVGPEGLDCSPRGDLPGFVRMQDARTLLLPDRRGNNRVDSLRNVVRDPRAALLFLLPGLGTTLRVNGRAHLDTDADLCQSFAVDDKPPRSVLVLSVEAVYFQCARAIVRAELWNPARHIDPKSLPSPGELLAGMSRIDGAAYDQGWAERARQTMW